MKVSAVIFDMDGTLTDSARLFHDAVEHGLSAFGIAIDRDSFHEWQTNFHPWSRLLELHGRKEVDESLIETITMTRMNELLALESAWMEGAEEAVQALRKRGMPMAIVTNAPEESVDIMCRALPLKELFSVIITASQTKERRKPDPYGLLMAAEKLGVTPSECIYVGDQRFDILAAQGAGMHDILCIGSHTPPEVELMAKHRVHSLPEMLTLID
jgi:phosphoglycolate phosphatase